MNFHECIIHKKNIIQHPQRFAYVVYYYQCKKSSIFYAQMVCSLAPVLVVSHPAPVVWAHH